MKKLLLVALIARFASCAKEKVQITFVDDNSKGLASLDEVQYVSGDTVSVGATYGRFNIVDGSKLDTLYLLKLRDSTSVVVHRRLAIIL